VVSNWLVRETFYMYVNLKYENFQDYAQKPQPIFCIFFWRPLCIFERYLNNIVRY